MKKNVMLILIVMNLVIMAVFFSGCSQKGYTATKKSQNRLEEIMERGYIEVVTEPYFAPNEFIDPSKEVGNQIVGSDIELAKFIAERIGVELRIVPLEFSAVLSSITESKYDLAISSLAYTPARAEAMNMSKGYYFSKESDGHGLVIRVEDEGNIKGVQELAEKVVVAQSGSLQELFVKEQLPKYKEFKRVSSSNDGLLMIQERKADVCVASISMAKLYISANKDSGLMVVNGFKFTEDESTSGIRIGMPLGEDELTEKINEIIDEVIETGIFEEWNIEYTEYAKSLGL